MTRGEELRLAVAFVRAGLSRAMLVAACTALVSGLLLVALTVVLFTWAAPEEQEALSGMILDGGVRGGYVLALLLICLAPLTLLRQVLRLGTATREQRLAALRLAGATPGEVRRLGALETGLPALAGGLLGVPVLGVLRAGFGGAGAPYADEGAVAQELRLVPTLVGPTWWQVVLVALAVGLLGALAGAGATRSLVVSPLGVSRRAPASPPRPWGLLPLALAPVLLLTGVGAETDEPWTMAAVAALLLGLLSLGPWLAHVAGTVAASRARSVPLLMAARRLVVDPRPAGRAAASVGVVSVVAGAGGVLLTALPDTSGGGTLRGVDPFYTVPVAVGGVVLLLALLLVVFSMAVGGVESLTDHRRSLASLAALGTPVDVLERAQRWEVGLVAVPMAAVGVGLGGLAFGWASGALTGLYAWVPWLVAAVTVLLAGAAAYASTRLMRPWLVRAAAPDHLRTP